MLKINNQASSTLWPYVILYILYIAGIGELSMWDFSGYEPYYMLYDHFLGETGCVHVVMFSLMDPFDEQIAQVFFWLNFLKSRVTPLLPLGEIFLASLVYYIMKILQFWQHFVYNFDIILLFLVLHHCLFKYMCLNIDTIWIRYIALLNVCMV